MTDPKNPADHETANLEAIDAAVEAAQADRDAKKPKKPKRQSRVDRWNEAATKAENVVAQMRELFGELDAALSDLDDVRSEYEEWRDNLPENLQSSALADKLNEVADLDIESPKSSLESAFDELDEIINTATGADLPRGFGRD